MIKNERFQKIREKCTEFAALSPLMSVTPKYPVTGEPHAFVTLTMPLPTMIADPKAIALLSELFANSDMVMTAKTETGIAYSFCVENIWEDWR